MRLATPPCNGPCRVETTPRPCRRLRLGAGHESEEFDGDAAYGDLSPVAAAQGDDEALGEVTNRLAAAHLGAAGACDAAHHPAPALPRTALKAMAPMTAAKALLQRADTPSSLASPEAMSPSMRWVGCTRGPAVQLGAQLLP